MLLLQFIGNTEILVCHREISTFAIQVMQEVEKRLWGPQWPSVTLNDLNERPERWRVVTEALNA